MEQAGIYARQSRGKAKSISEQLEAGLAVADEQGWQVAEKYQDGVSASRYARKVRDDWQRVLDDIAGGKLSILILWESSRGDRTLTSWSGMLDLCRTHGVQIYIISHERLYDPRRPRDWKTLAEDGVASASESDLLSVRVRRGHAGAARAGRPAHGRASTGYRRIYDPSTGELLGQEPDDLACPRQRSEYSTAYRGPAAVCPACDVWHFADIVREVVTSVARGVPIVALERDFDRRGVPTLNGAERWYRQRFRDIATNAAYVGLRLYGGQLYAAAWRPIVDEDVFYAARRVLGDPSRMTRKPGRYRHLLSHLATAAPCGSVLEAVGDMRYRCSRDGCITILKHPTDDFVERLVLGRICDPDVYARLRQAGDNTDREIVEARAEVGRLDDQLAEWRRSASAGVTSPESLAVIEADLKRQIAQAQARANRAEIPPFLRELVKPGVDTRARWAAAPLAARRDVVRAVADIVVSPGMRGRHVWDQGRLAASRWVGDTVTWGELWAQA